jgi:anti-anti-sigma factor
LEVKLQERKLNALKVKMTRFNNINLVTAYGDCDFCSVQLLKDSITEAVNADSRKLIVDVRHLKYLDSSALAVMLWAKHKIEEIGGKLVIVGLNCVRTKNAIGGLVNIATSIKEATCSLDKEGLGCM